MTDQEKEKIELENQLEQVKRRIQVLDMIEERLLAMRDLAQRARDEDLSDDAIQKLSEEVKSLTEQVKLLEHESTQLS